VLVRGPHSGSGGWRLHVPGGKERKETLHKSGKGIVEHVATGSIASESKQSEDVLC